MGLVFFSSNNHNNNNNIKSRKGDPTANNNDIVGLTENRPAVSQDRAVKQLTLRNKIFLRSVLSGLSKQ